MSNKDSDYPGTTVLWASAALVLWALILLTILIIFGGRN